MHFNIILTLFCKIRFLNNIPLNQFVSPFLESISSLKAENINCITCYIYLYLLYLFYFPLNKDCIYQGAMKLIKLLDCDYSVSSISIFPGRFRKINLSYLPNPFRCWDQCSFFFYPLLSIWLIFCPDSSRNTYFSSV